MDFESGLKQWPEAAHKKSQQHHDSHHFEDVPKMFCNTNAPIWEFTCADYLCQTSPEPDEMDVWHLFRNLARRC